MCQCVCVWGRERANSWNIWYTDVQILKHCLTHTYTWTGSWSSWDKMTFLTPISCNDFWATEKPLILFPLLPLCLAYRWMEWKMRETWKVITAYRLFHLLSVARWSCGTPNYITFHKKHWEGDSWLVFSHQHLWWTVYNEPKLKRVLYFHKKSTVSCWVLHFQQIWIAIDLFYFSLPTSIRSILLLKDPQGQTCFGIRNYSLTQWSLTGGSHLFWQSTRTNK